MFNVGDNVFLETNNQPLGEVLWTNHIWTLVDAGLWKPILYLTKDCRILPKTITYWVRISISPYGKLIVSLTINENEAQIWKELLDSGEYSDLSVTKHTIEV